MDCYINGLCVCVVSLPPVHFLSKIQIHVAVVKKRKDVDYLKKEKKEIKIKESRFRNNNNTRNVVFQCTTTIAN